MANTKAKRAERDSNLRYQLLEHLKDVVQSLLRPVGDTSRLYVRVPPPPGADPSRIPPKIFGTSQLTNTLCDSLEAVLIHGVKDSYGSRLSNFFRPDSGSMPVPNFWSVVMSVCHNDDIKEVCNLAFITSDVGRGRAWLRLMINGGKLTSYMDALTREAAVLKDYYSPTALLRCPESCYQLLGTLQPLSSLLFQLATNAAILNTWTQTPLVLAGLWVPPEGHTVQGWSKPVKHGIDIVSTMLAEEEQNKRDQQPAPIDRASIFMEEPSINDHLFYAIIAATPSTAFIEAGTAATDAQAGGKRKPLVVRTLYPSTDENGVAYPTPAVVKTQQGTFEENPAHHDEDDKETKESGIGTLEDKENEPLAEEDDANDTATNDGNDSLMGSSYYLERSASDDGSTVTSASSLDYDAIISKRLDNVGCRYIGPEQFDTLQEEAVSPDGSDDHSSPSQAFEVVRQPIQGLQVLRLSAMVSKVCKQAGLDEQNYQCQNCRAFIGVFYGLFRVCSMDGRSYCMDCHSNTSAIVPGRVLHNWDLRQHPVCDATALWLSDHYNMAMLDVRAANPSLYQHIDELGQLKILRTQLMYLRAYLFTCSTQGVADGLRRMLWPREHMHEHVHLYSVEDLVLISRGGLVAEVQEAVCYARLHIRDCAQCSARGFLCELCTKRDVLFPYQLDVAQTCPDCCAVYHRACANTATECPRCARRRERRRMVVQEEELDATLTGEDGVDIKERDNTNRGDESHSAKKKRQSSEENYDSEGVEEAIEADASGKGISVVGESRTLSAETTKIVISEQR